MASSPPFLQVDARFRKVSPQRTPRDPELLPLARGRPLRSSRSPRPAGNLPGVPVRPLGGGEVLALPCPDGRPPEQPAIAGGADHHPSAAATGVSSGINIGGEGGQRSGGLFALQRGRSLSRAEPRGPWGGGGVAGSHVGDSPSHPGVTDPGGDPWRHLPATRGCRGGESHPEETELAASHSWPSLGTDERGKDDGYLLIAPADPSKEASGFGGSHAAEAQRPSVVGRGLSGGHSAEAPAAAEKDDGYGATLREPLVKQGETLAVLALSCRGSEPRF